MDTQPSSPTNGDKCFVVETLCLWLKDYKPNGQFLWFPGEMPNEFYKKVNDLQLWTETEPYDTSKFYKISLALLTLTTSLCQI